MTQKMCCVCKIEKDVAEFSRHSRSKDGLQTQCRKCATEYSRRPENKERRSKQAAARWSSGLARDQRYRHLFGITLEDYYRMYFEQKEVCKICGRKQSARKARGDGVVENLSVDHDHKSGKVRGLLCHKCNSAIGFLQDNPNWLEKAIAYLAANETVEQTSQGEAIHGENRQPALSNQHDLL